MRATTDLHVLSVFTGPGGTGGNALGVFLDGGAVASRRRQAVAADLGFSETVFVDDTATGSVRIFTPAAELGFAGHPLVGTGWLLARAGAGPRALHPPAGEVLTWQQGETSWIRGRAEWAPVMELRQLDSPDDVDAIDAASVTGDFVYAWAWSDEAAGRVRSRSFDVETIAW